MATIFSLFINLADCDAYRPSFHLVTQVGNQLIILINIWDSYYKSFLHNSKPMSNFYHFLFQVSTTVILLWNYASQVINCVKVQSYNLWSLSNNSDPEYCKFKGIDRHWKVPTSLHLQKLLIRCKYSSDWEIRTTSKLTTDGVMASSYLSATFSQNISDLFIHGFIDWSETKENDK